MAERKKTVTSSSSRSPGGSGCRSSNDKDEEETTVPPSLCRRQWSDLPGPAAYLVMRGLLPALPDFFAFGAVCRAWRSLFASCKGELLSSWPPFLVSQYGPFRLFLGFFDGGYWQDTDPCDKSPSKLLGVSHGHLILTEEGRTACPQVLIVDPLSRGPDPRFELPTATCDVSHHGFFMTAPPTSPDCAVLALHRQGILYCRLGDTKWTSRDLDQVSFDSDVVDGASALGHVRPHQAVVLNGKIYALTHMANKVLVVDSLFPELSVTAVEVKGLPHTRVGYRAVLVESGGEIMCVYHEHTVDVGRRYIMYRLDMGYSYAVYRLDVARGEWSRLSSLGDDRCLFLNLGVAAIACKPAKWGANGDCIYSRDWERGMIEFHMKDGRVRHHEVPAEHNKSLWMLPSFCYK